MLEPGWYYESMADESIVRYLSNNTFYDFNVDQFKAYEPLKIRMASLGIRCFQYIDIRYDVWCYMYIFGLNQPPFMHKELDWQNEDIESSIPHKKE